MKVVALYNLKGGVGKTAAAVNLAYLAAAGGARTLLWDLDPQAAATFYLRVPPRPRGGGKALFRGRRDPADAVQASPYPNLSVLPAELSYRRMDLFLDRTGKPRKRLRQMLSRFEEDWDYVLLDCAPGLTLTSEAIFHSVHALLVPVVPTTLSLRTLETIAAFRREEGLHDLSILPFVSMADARRRLHRQVMTSLLEEYPGVLRSFIPYSAEVERMGQARAPLACFAPRSRPGRAFAGLWDELAKRLEEPAPRDAVGALKHWTS